MEYIIETNRLRLRRINENDFDNLKAIISDEETMKYYPTPYDDNGVNKWIKWNLACYEKRGFGLFAVELKENNTFIGDCGITLQNIDNELVFEIGYHFNKKYWKHGYAIEAAKACKKYFFENTNYDEVYSYMNIENIASINVAKRNKMKFIKDYYQDNEHLAVYRITKKEYLDNMCFTLNNGIRIPKIGYGTWQINNDIASSCVELAIKNGYRHIDSAVDYGNEEGVGKGIKSSNIKRENLFVTTKIPANVKSYSKAKEILEESFRKLDLDYIDLVLIHSPTPWEDLWKPNASRYFKENIEVWKVLEEYYLSGKIKTIGLSNFQIDDIENIMNNCKIKPMVNQIRIHIGHHEDKLIEYCKKNNILVEAYSPIFTGRLLNNKEVEKIANKYNVSIARLSIKFCMQLGYLALPKTTHEEYMIDNLKLDFEISKEDMEILNKFNF